MTQLSWSELNKKMMEPVEPRHSRQAVVEQQMVAIHNAADWEVDLAPGLLLQVVDLTPYVNTSALKVRGGGGLWQGATGRALSSTRVCMLHEGNGLQSDSKASGEVAEVTSGFTTACPPYAAPCCFCHCL